VATVHCPPLLLTLILPKGGDFLLKLPLLLFSPPLGFPQRLEQDDGAVADEPHACLPNDHASTTVAIDAGIRANRPRLVLDELSEYATDLWPDQPVPAVTKSHRHRISFAVAKEVVAARP
jgi:hypothetical protein